MITVRANRKVLYAIYHYLMGTSSHEWRTQLPKLESIYRTATKAVEAHYYLAQRQLTYLILVIPLSHLGLTLTAWVMSGQAVPVWQPLLAICPVLINWFYAYIRYTTLTQALHNLKTNTHPPHSHFSDGWWCYGGSTIHFGVTHDILTLIISVWGGLIVGLVLNSFWGCLVFGSFVVYHGISCFVWLVQSRPSFIEQVSCPDEFSARYDLTCYVPVACLDRDHDADFLVDTFSNRLLIKKGLTDPLTGQPLEVKVNKLSCGHIFNTKTLEQHYDSTPPGPVEESYPRKCPVCQEVIYRQSIV